MSGSSRRGIGAVDLLLDGFAGYLRSERGVTELTVDVYVADIRRFLVDALAGLPNACLPGCYRALCAMRLLGAALTLAVIVVVAAVH